jgi:hypothetical protein
MSPQAALFNIDSYFDEFADASAMAEATRFKTIPTGSYTGQVTKRDGQYFESKAGNYGEYWSAVFNDSDEVNPNWRKGVRLSADLSNGDGKRLSMIRIEASWEAKRDLKTGKLDKLFTRWNQLTRAMFPNSKDEAKSTGEVLTMLSQFPIKVFVTESFQVPAIDGTKKWVSPKTDEEAKQYREAGYEAKNFVQSVGKL